MFQKHEITLFKLVSYKNMSSADIKREKTSFEDRSMQNKKSVMSLIKHMPFPRYPPMKLGYLFKNILLFNSCFCL